jgi:hypothetical protein
MKENKRWGLFGLALAALFFVSCDKEEYAEVAGPEVAVQIRLLRAAEGGEEDVVRAVSWKEPETVFAPAGNGMLLEMSLEEDDSPLRGDEKPLEADTYFRVVALKTGTITYVSHGDFKVGQEGPLTPFTVPGGTTYDFLCFSCNSKEYSSLPSFNPARGASLNTAALTRLDIETGKDWLWEKKTLVVGTSSPVLSILLKGFMARVRLVVDCSYNGWTITGIDNNIILGLVANTAVVSFVSGATLSTPSAGNKSIMWGSLTPAEVQESNVMLVWPKVEGDLTVNIPHAAIKREDLDPIPTDARSGQNLTATFRTALEVGKGYKIVVKLRAPMWAGSNIYWVAVADDEDPNHPGYLTFDTSDAGNQGYQGVYFKWGSLVGVSPVGDWENNSTETYRPKGTSAADGWEEATYATWASVPFWSNTTYGMDIDDTQLANKVGDICRFINSGFRLPKLGEMGVGTNTVSFDGNAPIAGGWLKEGTKYDDQATTNPYGTYDLIKDGRYWYAYNVTAGNAIFPPTGYRNYGHAGVQQAGYDGHYWSSTSNTGTYGRYLLTNISGIHPSDNDHRETGDAVRCVKN